jgi:hypothetical protein
MFYRRNNFKKFSIAFTGVRFRYSCYTVDTPSIQIIPALARTLVVVASLAEFPFFFFTSRILSS